MNALKPDREFAISVVRTLRAAGYQALWAGGCVRDQRLGFEPKDYDVATTATPDQIRETFGRRRTIEIGVSFGVITVLGNGQQGQVEVATFRRDAGYSDGRRPDHVTFSSPVEDAQRRDFTINGIFHDPLTGEDIDYVGGGEDLEHRVIRAIGNPHERFAEDKLRMLRAVRFAATYGFHIEARTFAALQEHAGDLLVVSAERIAAEMRRMLVHGSRRKAIELLAESRLLPIVLPEVVVAGETKGFGPPGGPTDRTLLMLDALDQPSFSAALAVLLRDAVLTNDDRSEEDIAAAPANAAPPQPPLVNTQVVNAICRRWRLSNDETAGVLLCLRHEWLLRYADRLPWPEVQRVLTHARIQEMLAYVQAVCNIADGEAAGPQFCRAKLALPAEQWNPPPLVTGDQLKAAGLRPGPHFRTILEAVRDAQLEGAISEPAEALEKARQIAASMGET